MASSDDARPRGATAGPASASGGWGRYAAGPVLFGVVALAAAGCGGGSSSSTSSAPSPAPTKSGTKVTVAETDFHLALSTSRFTPGTYTFVAANKGHTTHALEIEGPGVGERKTGTLSPGGSQSLTVTLKGGTYELYCPVDDHKSLGMAARITVG